jgi:hypothetical protein
VAARILSPALRQAFERLNQTNGVCAELAAAVSSRGTLILALPFVRGALTLNALNTIVLESRLCDHGPSEVVVSLLAHECSHIQQAHLIDSIQQELAAYRAAARVAEALNLKHEKDRLGRALILDGTSRKDLEEARDWILKLAESSPPTQTIYRRLPLYQPAGILPNLRAAAVQLSSGGLAGIQVAWLLAKEWYTQMRRTFL